MTAIRMLVNPSDIEAAYVFHDTGLIEARGTAAPVPTTGRTPVTWFDFPVALRPGRAFAISNWSQPSGYTLDYWGGLHHWGQAVQPSPLPPYITNEGHWARDLVLDPANPSRGFVLRDDGRIYGFGGLPNHQPTNGLIGNRLARRLSWNWSSNQGYVLDGWGGIHRVNGAANFHTQRGYFPGRDIVVDMIVVEWGAAPKFLLLDASGGIHPNGYDFVPYGHPYWPGQQVAMDLHLHSGGQDGQVTEMVMGDRRGALHRWKVNTRPRVTFVQPPGTVTATTRPRITWHYTDDQRHPQAKWELRIHAGTSPTPPTVDMSFYALSGVGTTNTVVPAKDHPNGNYSAFVRVTDTAGSVSDWAVRNYTVNVAPLQPPRLTARPVTNGVELTVLAPSDHAALDTYIVQGEMPDGSWAVIDGGYHMRLHADNTVVDYEGAHGESRRYRAFHIRRNPYRASEPSVIVTASPIGDRKWSLLDTSTKRFLRIYVNGSFEFEEQTEAGVFSLLGNRYPTVLSDGENKGMKADLTCFVESKREYDLLNEIARPGKTLLLRDGFGRAWYVQVTGSRRYSQRKSVGVDPGYSVGYVHNITLPLTQVSPPLYAPEDDPTLAPD